MYATTHQPLGTFTTEEEQMDLLKRMAKKRLKMRTAGGEANGICL
jgi:hypothetical protein